MKSAIVLLRQLFHSIRCRIKKSVYQLENALTEEQKTILSAFGLGLEDVLHAVQAFN